jgi:hypothetical protein
LGRRRFVYFPADGDSGRHGCTERTEAAPAPEKALTLATLPSSDALANVNALGKHLDIRLRIDNTEISNIATQILSLENTGNVPIMPADFSEPLSLTVSPPWKIVAVQNSSKDIPFEWTRKDDETFIAPHILINPGDHLVETVYATDLTLNRRAASEQSPTLAVEVHARIVNMKGFSSLRATIANVRIPQGLFAIYIDGYGVVFLIATASALLYWYVRLLQRARMFTPESYHGALLIVVAALLSFATAEVLTYYAFGTLSIISMFMHGSPLWAREWLNWLVLSLHAIASVYLYVRARSVHLLITRR